MFHVLRGISAVVHSMKKMPQFEPSYLVRHSSFLSSLSQLDAGTPSLSLHNVNWIQKRNRHVTEDGAEPHRVLRIDKRTGKRTIAAIVPRTFYRLHWGIWIRTVCGRDKTVHKKTNATMRLKRQHVFCNGQQSHLLDRMVAGDPYFRRRHYYIDDEYEPYHSREEYLFTRRSPLPPSPGIEKYLD